ncbi:MAG TPA: MarR family transcriptional regulator [Bacteroidia bacterium]|nr:MarR family transcriptional regulator [Bacteroidia bacterium]
MRTRHSRSNSILYLLERTLRQSRGYLQQTFKRSGSPVSVDQWLILQQIKRTPAISLQEVAAATAKDPASVTRMIAQLEKKKLVKRKTNPADRRGQNLFISTNGEKALQKCAVGLAQYQKAVGKGISQDELNLLKKVLDKLYENSGGRL